MDFSFTDHIIFFDGVCNLCNGAVQFVIRKDKKKYFQFSSLQSQYAQRHLDINDKMKSILLVENGKIYTKSSAALRIVKHLKGFWSILYIFIIIPPFIRNAVYDLIARNRYKWFGKKKECMIPTESLKNRFLE